MQEAYERNIYEESPEIDGPNESDILNILAISLYKQGNLKRALAINDKLTKIGKNKIIVMLGAKRNIIGLFVPVFSVKHLIPI